MTLKELKWIDGFMAGIKKHVHVRSRDRVLILPPNKVYKLNASGAALLLTLLKGKSITRLKFLRQGDKAQEVHNFFCDLRAFFNDCPVAPGKRRAVEMEPFGFDFTVLPILGEIAVTYRCNNDCAFCYVGGRTAREKSGEMSLARIKKIIRIFKQQAQIPFFSLTGGEPTLRTDLEKIIRYAVHLGLRVNLITNGTLIDKARALRLRKSGLDSAQVSLEGTSARVHDELTGTPGSWQRSLAGIRHLRQAGISVQTNTTVNQKNATTLGDLPQFLKQEGIQRFSMNLYIPTGSSPGQEELFFAYSRLPELIEDIKKRARDLDLTFYWYSPVPHCYYNPIARGLGNKSCAAMDGLLSVSPTGEVLPCSSYHESLGNLLTQDFESIWFSRRARFFKHKHFAPRECRSCDKFTACQSACPLYWDYAGTRELLKSTPAGSLCKELRV